MSPSDATPTETEKWDPGPVEKAMGVLRPFLKLYHRSEVIYDKEFTASVDRALQERPQAGRILAWTDGAGSDVAGPAAQADAPTVEKRLITSHIGEKATKTGRKSRLILLTSDTTAIPKGAKHSGGATGNLIAILQRTPWRLGETTVSSHRCSTPGASRSWCSLRRWRARW